MEISIKLLKDSIEICENAISYNSKFISIEKEFYPDRYKHTMRKIHKLEIMIESYKKSKELLEEMNHPKKLTIIERIKSLFKK